jgi:ribosomal protein S18 acetylase RimI-like enzyme
VELLRDAVQDGASVGFVRVPEVSDAERWWRRYLAGGWTWVAGTVSLRVDQPENGPHRAELTKLLVHRDFRGRGLASRLVTAAEEAAVQAGRTLLLLDTETGSPAEGIYERWGWHRVGTIEGYAVNPDGGVRGTTLFSKVLEEPLRATHD